LGGGYRAAHVQRAGIEVSPEFSASCPMDEAAVQEFSERVGRAIEKQIRKIKHGMVAAFVESYCETKRKEFLGH
jgi:hypothetical protein